jgi:predicted O-methyltransferase YrrM
MPWRILQTIWRILQYLRHLFFRRHRKGYGIHSPYLFEFVHGVIFNASRITVPSEVVSLHRELKRDRTVLSGGGASSPSVVERSERRSVGDFVKHASVSVKYGSLLHRITRWFCPEVIIELGTGLGISTLYLASGSPGIPLHTIEGDAGRADFSASLFKRFQFSDVQVYHGDIGTVLERVLPDCPGRMLAYMDGNHRHGPTIAYVRKLLAVAGEEAVVVLDDIYWSKGMQRAWKELVSWPEVRVSLDLFQMGILLLRRDLSKDHVKIKF